jgi:hypothetical protein
VADFIYQLEKESRELYHMHKEFVREVMRLGIPLSGIGDHTSTKHRWRLLRHKAIKFSQNWRHYLMPLEDRASQDRITIIDRLLSPDIERLLAIDESHRVKTVADELRERLRAMEVEGINVLDMLTYYGNTVNSSEIIHDEGDGMPLGFELRNGPQNSLPLALLRGDNTVNIQKLPDLNRSSHRVRFWVRHQTAGQPGAILAVDSWTDDEIGERFLRTIWTHKADSERIWCKAAAFLLKVMAVTSTDQLPIGYRIFSPHGEREGLLFPNRVPGEAVLRDDGQGIFAAEVVRRQIAELRTLDYFELEGSSTRSRHPVVFFADTEPLAEMEHQAGVALPASLFFSLLKADLVQLVGETGRWSFPAQIWSAVFASLSQVLSLQD